MIALVVMLKIYFYIIIMNLGQNVCLDHLWVRFSKCYDTQVSVTGPSWSSCFFFFFFFFFFVIVVVLFFYKIYDTKIY